MNPRQPRKPSWLTSAIYILLNSGCEYHTNGIMGAGDIKTLLEEPSWDKPCVHDVRDHIPDYILSEAGYDFKTGARIQRPLSYSSEEQKHILAVMRKFELSYQLSDGREFIPALCDSKMPENLYPAEYQRHVSYEFRYSFLPDSLVQRLMVRECSRRKYTAQWRKGFRFDESALTAVVDAGAPNDTLRIDIFTQGARSSKEVLEELTAQIRNLQQTMGMTSEEFIVVHGPRGEIPVPAKMVFLALEQKIPELYLYSNENGLITESPNRIIGELYPTDIPEETDELIQLGEKYTQIIPDNLIALLDRLIQDNYQARQDFVDLLLAQLEARKDNTTQEITRAASADPKTRRNILDTLRKTASGICSTISVLADSPDALRTLISIASAVTAAATQYGPEIAELLSKFRVLLF